MNTAPAASSDRTRLSVEARREQLLNEAVRLLLSEGLSAMSMEALARAAGVSKGLVYHYFDTQAAVLNGVLSREFAFLREQGVIEALQGGDPTDVLVDSAIAYLRTIARRGPLVHQLLADVAVTRLLDFPNRRFCRSIAGKLIRLLGAKVSLPRHMQRVGIDMLMAIPEQAGRLVFERRLHVDMAEELCGIHIRAAVQGLADEFGTP